MKKFVCCILTLTLLNVFAKSQSDSTLVAMYMDGDTSHSRLQLVQNYYSSTQGASLVRNALITQLENELTQENHDNSLRLIDLYFFIAKEDDYYLPTLFLIKGNIYANLLDTNGIRHVMNDFAKNGAIPPESKAEIQKNLESLYYTVQNTYPAIQRMNGYWATSDVSSIDHRAILLLKIVDEGDSVFFDILPECRTAAILKPYTKGEPIQSAFRSKKIVPFGDSVYIAWTSESLESKSDLGAYMLRSVTHETSANIAAALSVKNRFSLGTQLMGQLGAIALEKVVNKLIDEAFMPKKRVFACELKLKIENEYLLTGTLFYHVMEERADGKIQEYNETISLKLMRWDESSDVVFASPRILGGGISHAILPNDQNTKEYAKDASTDFNMVRSMRRCKKNDEEYAQTYYYNFLQIIHLMNYNDSILRAEGYAQTGLECLSPDSSQILIGICGLDITPRVKKKYNSKANSGVIVLAINPRTPAYFTKLRLGDVIVGVDGEPIANRHHLAAVLNRCNPSRRVYLNVMRGAKLMDIAVKPIRVPKTM